MKVKETFTNLFFLHFEWVALLGFLIMAAQLNPESTASTFCLFEKAGLSFCPGSGLGKSMAFTFRGNISESFQAHPAGAAAILIIMVRIGSILHRNKQSQQTEELK